MDFCWLGTDWASDWSEDSDWEEGEDLAQRTKATKKNDLLALNRPRSSAQLQPYGRFFNQVGDDDDDTDQLWNHIPPEWNRTRIYEHFARRTRCIRPFRIIAYPDWIDAQATAANEKLYVKDRNVCRCCYQKTFIPDGSHPLDLLLLTSLVHSLLKLDKTLAGIDASDAHAV